MTRLMTLISCGLALTLFASMAFRLWGGCEVPQDAV